MRNLHLFAALALNAALAACSSGGGAGGGNTHGSTTGTSAGGAGTTGTTATTSGSTTATTTTTSTTNTGTASASTTTTSTTSATSSTSTGGSGACTNTADETKINALGPTQLQTDVQNCGQQSFGAEPQTTTCIKNATQLSDACVACFDTNVHCAIMHCIAQCGGGASAQCNMCLHTNCTPAFNTCSGLMGP